MSNPIVKYPYRSFGENLNYDETTGQYTRKFPIEEDVPRGWVDSPLTYRRGGRVYKRCKKSCRKGYKKNNRKRTRKYK
jgi:hypothetical protein